MMSETRDGLGHPASSERVPAEKRPFSEADLEASGTYRNACLLNTIFSCCSPLSGRCAPESGAHLPDRGEQHLFFRMRIPAFVRGGMLA